MPNECTSPSACCRAAADAGGSAACAGLYLTLALTALRREVPKGKCFDEDSCSRIIEAAIQTADATFGGYVPTKLIEKVVYADDDGKAFAEPAAAKCPENDARGHIGSMIGWFSRRYTDSEKHNPNNLLGQPYFCAYRDRFDRVKDSRTKTWSYKPTE